MSKGRFNIVDTNGVIMRAFTACDMYGDKDMKFQFLREIAHIPVEEQVDENEEYLSLKKAYERRRMDATITLIADKFVRLLTGIVADCKGEYLMLGFDRKSWRKSVYPEYKGNRVSQFTPLEKALLSEVFGHVESFITKYAKIPMVAVDNAEFDDIAYAFAKEWQDCRVFSVDSDLLQLYAIRGYEQWDFDQNKKVVPDGLTAERFLWIKVLHGDAKDNIPNVKQGLGPVKWGKKLDDGTLSEFLEKEGLLEAYGLNRRLIDLSHAPKDIITACTEALGVGEGVATNTKCGGGMRMVAFDKTPFKPQMQVVKYLTTALGELLNGK